MNARPTDDDDLSIARVARDIRALLLEIREITKYMREAESEIPEKMRRFMMYFHDMHDLKNMHEELGLIPPTYVLREIERCYDRLRHLLEDLFDPDKEGHFEHVRKDMSKREGNKYDWSKALAPPKENYETRKR